ncbi:MAG: response regulator transcription factor [Clostridiales bacterium]|nr:response regulator transcription factor [Clostridiales bacterium]
MKILIVDDDPLVSGALKVILENDSDGDAITVDAQAQSGESAVRLVLEGDYDVVLMDIRMDGMDGLQAASKVLEQKKDARIIFLTTFLDDEYINKALSVGAKGYILKQDCEGIATCVRAVYEGKTVFAGKVVEKLPDLLNRKERFDPSEFDITPKEMELIEHVADGLSNKEIAEKMFLSEGTVRNMVSSVLSKLDLRDRTQLACFYYQKMI